MGYALIGGSNFNGGTLPQAGALSTSALLLSGTWITGGSATTTKPQLLIEPTGTTSTAWSTSGTGLGVNATSGFAGHLMSLQVNGVLSFAVNTDGTTYVAGGAFFGGGSTVLTTSSDKVTILGSGFGIGMAATLPVGWNSGSTTMNGSNDTYLMRAGAAASIRIGNVASASPVANTLTIGESSRAGTDTDTAGASGTLQPGAGTGAGATTPLILMAPIKVASGSGAQTQTEGMRVQAVNTAIGISFYGVSAVARQVLATGTGKTVDNVITALQNLGLVSQT